MSGGIVDVIGGTAVFALATGVLAYSCGPNIVVGGLGLLGRGAMATANKAKKAYLESQQKSEANPEVQTDLQRQITQLDESISYNLQQAGGWVIHMIPVAGPLINMKQAVE